MMCQQFPTSESKDLLRRQALKRRGEAHKHFNQFAAMRLKKLLGAGLGIDTSIIAGYWPIRDEIDCRPALERLNERGYQIALPAVESESQILAFRAWKPGDTLEGGPFGTFQPNRKALVLTPDMLLLPLVAFDQLGHRLGYGSGYYDRTIEALRFGGSVIAIGVGYDDQEVENIPWEGHDQVMDAVVTERRTLWFNEAVKGQRD